MAILTLARPLAAWRVLVVFLIGLIALPMSSARGQGAGAQIDEPRIPEGVNVFDLDLRQTQAFSRSSNFKVVGHSYLKGPWLTASTFTTESPMCPVTAIPPLSSGISSWMCATPKT